MDPLMQQNKLLKVAVVVLSVVILGGVVLNLPSVSQRIGLPSMSPTPSVSILPSVSETPVACTMDAKICPDGSAVGRIGPTCEFAACPTIATSGAQLTPSIQDKYGIQTHVSKKFGVQFKYLGVSYDQTIRVVETGDRIYVYPVGQSGDPKIDDDYTRGQYVEFIPAPKGKTIEEKIAQTIKGYNAAKCKVTPDKKRTNRYYIEYVNGPPMSDDPGAQGDCPAPYATYGGLAYFILDPEMPDTLMFFSIGQYYIPADTKEDGQAWQDTFQVVQ